VLTRRHVLAILPAAALAQPCFGAPTLTSQRAFIGTTGKESQGIFTSNFDPKTGTFDQPEFAAKVENSDFMALSPKNQRRLYATGLADGSSAVTGFNIVDGPNPLQMINQQTAKGATAVYLSFDPSGRVAMEANWGSGSINTYLVGADGALSTAVEHIEYGSEGHGPSPIQTLNRAHSILWVDGGFVLVNNYGQDRIYIYRLDASTAKLTPADPVFLTCAAGSAPRHLAVHRNGKWIYNVNELANTVDLLLWNSKDGKLTLQSTVALLPDGHPRSNASDLMLSPDNRYLYAGNRGVNGFTVFAVQRDGSLGQIQFREQTGVQNRQFCLDATGRWFIAANTGSGDITIFPRDPKTGLLGEQKGFAKLQGACFVLWA
jgi:6-phosphogluconolactonase